MRVTQKQKSCLKKSLKIYFWDAHNGVKEDDLPYYLPYKITFIEKITIYYEKRIETFVYGILWQIEFLCPIRLLGILEMNFVRIFEATFFREHLTNFLF